MRASILRLCLFSVVTIIAYGCATTPKEVPPFSPNTPPEGKAIIYFYRPEYAGRYPYKILENENYVFDMKPGKYLEYFVYPGQFQYRAKTGTMSGLISDPLDIEIKAGEGLDSAILRSEIFKNWKENLSARSTLGKDL